MKRLLCVGLVFVSVPAVAQSVQTMHTMQLSDQQINGIIEAGNACLEKMPYACADYTTYIRNWLNEARKPKPPEAPKPEPKKAP